MRYLTTCFLLGFVVACADQPAAPSAAARPLTLTITGGNYQNGTPAAPLPLPVTVRLVDGDGAPVADRTLTFTPAAGSGRVAPASVTTGANGTATIVWTLGAEPGRQTVTVRGTDVRTLTLVAFAVPAECPTGGCPTGALTGPVPFRLLDVATYDGSGESVHPDLRPGWQPGEPLLLAFTPYPGGNALVENPSLAASPDAVTWRTPPGVTNPLAVSTGGHLSDPDIVREPDSEALALYYREVVGGRNRIHRVRSENGRDWSAPRLVLDVPSHAALSPAVVTDGPHARWQMWTVDAGAAGCVARAVRVHRRTSSDGITWGAPAEVALQQPGQVIWHLDVQWLPDRAEYWALYNAYPTGGSCTTQAIYLARSPDGITWSTPEAPLFTVDDIVPFRDLLYRGTFRRSPDGQWLELILSGAALEGGYRWRLGRVVVGTDGLFAAGARRQGTGRWQRPPLVPLPPPEPHDMPEG